ncbi:MAG: PQQ-binding-like beta-propeller repeat protein [Blastocatellia bacterium]|nr:PQQ-binding-like beta-propeller repeat protein [Blastocatellia bacterium]
MNRTIPLLKLTLLALLVSCTVLLPTYYAQKKGTATTKKIDDKVLKQVESRAGDWLSYGRNYAETRFSPLNKINAANIKQLGLAWSYETNTNRGLEATPIVVDGVMYTTGSWSVVFALDAKTGQQLWKYDPNVPKAYGAKACCDVVNRGVAVYKGKVYVGTIDGRLIALDAETGKEKWSAVTVDQNQAYTITAAPRIVKGKVIIGPFGKAYQAA